MTPEGWRKSSYGEAMQETDLRAETAVDLPVLSVTKSRGPMLASERFGKVMHGRDLRKYRVAPRNSVVADPMLLWDGSIGLQSVVDAGLVSPDYRVYQPAPDVAPRFLGYVVRSPPMLPHYQGGARGTNVRRNRIARSDFLAIPLALPPLAEQKKIAAILSSADDAIEATQAVIDQLRVVKKSMMVELLTRGLPGRHANLKMTEIGEVPKDWHVVELDECIEHGRPICYGILMPGKGHPGGVPVIKVKDIKNNRIDERDILLTTPELDHQYRRSKLRTGDVLLTIRGTTGRLARVPETLNAANITQDTARLSIRAELSRDFIFYCLQGPNLQRQIQDHTRGQAVKGINIGDVRRLLAPLPARAEQDAIASLFDSIAENEARNAADLDGLRFLKSALMSVLLTGEVRVKADNEAT